MGEMDFFAEEIHEGDEKYWLDEARNEYDDEGITDTIYKKNGAYNIWNRKK